MLRVELRKVPLKKRYPLRISRGISYGSENLFVLLGDGQITGIGEAAPGTGHGDDFAETACTQIHDFLQGIELSPYNLASIEAEARKTGMEAPAIAGLDTAVWDYLAKREAKPLFRYLGLIADQPPTSITIGINPLDVIRERVPELLDRTGARFLKIKLGNPEGIEADRESYAVATQAAAARPVRFRVDANGGWSTEDAHCMINWLAERGCDYVEQPLAKGEEADLPKLFETRRLPIFLDESVHIAADVHGVADRCDGINLKLMKTGGITEALRAVELARRYRLSTMIGCMGESSVAIAAGAAIGSLFDHIDLDSHLNLDPDPATGLGFEKGVLVPAERPGHGAELR
ncbi:MAG: L-Ala-D/L-Glu epimerase [Fimbriimonadaceae bacterium]|nr:L-Ala-D/L-Glu epimerase [Fimbriimonadaceae bacterium]